MDFSGNISKKTSAVDRITLECLTNTRHYEKYLVKNNRHSLQDKNHLLGTPGGNFLVILTCNVSSISHMYVNFEFSVRFHGKCKH